VSLRFLASHLMMHNLSNIVVYLSLKILLLVGFLHAVHEELSNNVRTRSSVHGGTLCDSVFLVPVVFFYCGKIYIT